MGTWIHRGGLHENNAHAGVMTAGEFFRAFALNEKFRNAAAEVFRVRRQQGYVTQAEHIIRKQLVNDGVSKTIEKNSEIAKRTE